MSGLDDATGLERDLRALATPTSDLPPADVRAAMAAGAGRRRQAVILRSVAAVVVVVVLLGSAAAVARRQPVSDVVVGSAPQRTVEIVPAAAATPDQIRATADKVAQRLQALGVPATVEVVGGVIQVHFPHPGDAATAIPLVTQHHPLTFRPVLATSDLRPGSVPPGSAVTAPTDDVTAPVTLDGNDRRYQLGPVLAGPDIVTGASTGIDQQTGQWLLRPHFRNDTMAEFNTAAKLCNDRDIRCPLGQLAFVLDGRVLSAPSVHAPSFTADQIQVSSDFTEASAKELAAQIESSLPIPVTVR